MNAVLRLLARASRKTSTAHSAVMRGSLYDEPTIRAPWRRARRTRSSGVAAGEPMKERLLLGGIARRGGEVARRHEERAVAVEANLADPPASRLDEAAVAAREAAHGAVRELFDQLPFAHARVEDLGERRRAAVGRVVRQEGDDAALRPGRHRRLPGVS